MQHRRFALQLELTFETSTTHDVAHHQRGFWCRCSLSKLLNDVYRDSTRFHQLSLSLSMSPSLSLAVPVHQLMAVSFLKVSRIFVILSHVFLSRQSVFIAPALSHLGLSIRMYTYVCVSLLFVFVRVAPWNVYIELFIVLRLRLCLVWVNKLWFTLDFITCSRIFLFVSSVYFTYLLSLCAAAASCEAFSILISLIITYCCWSRIACGKFTMILLLRWFHSLRHWLLLLLLLRIFVASCC